MASMTRRAAAVLLATAGTTGAVLASPTSATAATGSTIRALAGVHSIQFTAGSGQTNKLHGSLLPGTTDGNGTYVHNYRFRDDYPIAAGSGCSYPTSDHRTVDCGLPDIGDYYPQFTIDLGDGNDSISFAPNVGQDSVLEAGSGNDHFDTGVTFAFVDAGPGNDAITTPRDVDGGPGNDRLYGSGDVNEITGGTGNDLIEGAGGNDQLYGNSGRDTIRAGTGDDYVSGGADDDVLYGNSGDDRLLGGAGADRISGGPGRNTITQ